MYSGKEVDSVYLGDKAEVCSCKPGAAAAEQGTLTLEEQIKAGGALHRHLFGLSSTERTGARGRFPTIGQSDLLTATTPKRASSSERLDRQVTVNGKTFNSVMPPMSQLNDDEIANILTYVLNSWDNKGGRIAASEVKAERAKGNQRTGGSALKRAGR